VSKRTQHVIAAVTFAPRENDGPAECSCGEWAGLASEFSEHRRAQGAPKAENYPIKRNAWQEATSRTWASR